MERTVQIHVCFSEEHSGPGDQLVYDLVQYALSKFEDPVFSGQMKNPEHDGLTLTFHESEETGSMHLQIVPEEESN